MLNRPWEGPGVRDNAVQIAREHGLEIQFPIVGYPDPHERQEHDRQLKTQPDAQQEF